MTLLTTRAVPAEAGLPIALILAASGLLVLNALAALPALALAGALLLARFPRAALAVLVIAGCLTLLGASIDQSDRPRPARSSS